MISFNNKFLSIFAFLVIGYMLVTTGGELTKDIKNQAERLSSSGEPVSARNSIVIDPSNPDQELSLTQKLAIKFLAPDVEKKIDDAKKMSVPPKDYQANLGDKVFFEIKENDLSTTYTAIIGEETKSVPKTLSLSIIGMKIGDEKAVKIEDEKNSSEKKLKVLFIERMENR